MKFDLHQLPLHTSIPHSGSLPRLATDPLLHIAPGLRAIAPTPFLAAFFQWFESPAVALGVPMLVRLRPTFVAHEICNDAVAQLPTKSGETFDCIFPQALCVGGVGP